MNYPFIEHNVSRHLLPALEAEATEAALSTSWWCLSASSNNCIALRYLFMVMATTSSWYHYVKNLSFQNINSSDLLEIKVEQS